jgi:hypothetical protein
MKFSLEVEVVSLDLGRVAEPEACMGGRRVRVCSVHISGLVLRMYVCACVCVSRVCATGSCCHSALSPYVRLCVYVRAGSEACASRRVLRAV